MILHDNPIEKMEAFDFSSVTITDSRLLNQFGSTLLTYLEIPNDSLLYGFRKRAGMDAPGKSLEGWYGDDIFNTFGQYLSGFARMYAVSKDPELLCKLEELLEGWAETIDQDGFCFYSNRNPKATHYFIDKMVGALVDIYRYTGKERALDCLSRITDWAAARLDRSNPYAKNSMHSPTEWYTLSENFYSAFEITGDTKYKEMGDVFLYDEYYQHYLEEDFEGLMKAGEESTTRRYHAYSHVNCLCGAAMAFKLTGEERYLKVLVNAYKMLKNTQFFITGGFGPNETFMLPGQRSECLHSETSHFETPCGSWAAFKLVKYLIGFTGDAQYGDWAEQLLYNGIGAALPVKSNGEVMYFSKYNINGAQKETMNPWSCCTGTYPLAVADYFNQIYYKDSDNVYVNLYVSSAVDWTPESVKCRLQQKTEFPVKEFSTFTISAEKKVRFKLGFRIPGWCSCGMEIKIGESACEGSVKNGWFVVEREWHDGEVVKVRIPMKISLCSVEGDGKYPAAFTYGPVVLAAVQEEKPEISEEGMEKLLASLAEKQEGTFEFTGQAGSTGDIEWKPFYTIAEGCKYYMFFDPKHCRIGSDQLDIGPVGNCWEKQKWGVVSTGYKADFRIKFHGSGIRWVGRQLDKGGKASIYIDGRYVDTVDQYGPFSGVPWMWEKKGLAEGEHEMRVEAENEKNIDSRFRTVINGCVINVCHLSVLSE